MSQVSKIFLVFSIVILMCGNAMSQKSSIITPKQGSAERKAVLDPVRAKVEKFLGKKVKFEVSTLRIKNGYAFLIARPVGADGKKLNYKGTPVEEEVKEGIFDEGVLALLQKKGNKWVVLEYDFGRTDSPIEEYMRKHPKAPRSIFGSP